MNCLIGLFWLLFYHWSKLHIYCTYCIQCLVFELYSELYHKASQYFELITNRPPTSIMIEYIALNITQGNTTGGNIPEHTCLEFIIIADQVHQ